MSCMPTATGMKDCTIGSSRGPEDSASLGRWKPFAWGADVRSAQTTHLRVLRRVQRMPLQNEDHMLGMAAIMRDVTKRFDEMRTLKQISQRLRRRQTKAQSSRARTAQLVRLSWTLNSYLTNPA
jgi:hypothetical protein